MTDEPTDKLDDDEQVEDLEVSDVGADKVAGGSGLNPQPLPPEPPREGLRQ